MRTKPGQLEFRYRDSSLPASSIVLSAIFNCPIGEIDDERLGKSLNRKQSQPLAQRSFGSTFKNPPGDFAARLIEECGLKGTRVGGAMISEKHANFIVNVGKDTTARDVEDLIRLIMERIRDEYEVNLQPEVIIIGNR